MGTEWTTYKLLDAVRQLVGYANILTGSVPNSGCPIILNGGVREGVLRADECFEVMTCFDYHLVDMRFVVC